jgi:hypothetical protein
MYTDHFALRYLINKKVFGGEICIWLLLFQEYDFEVIVKLGNLNSRPDHLSCILLGEHVGNLDDTLLYVHLFVVQMVDDYFTNIVHFLSIGVAPPNFIVVQKKKLVVKAADYQLISRNLYKLVADGILRHCVLEREISLILVEEHEGVVRGHYARKVMAQNIVRARLWWPTLHQDAKEFCQTYDVC